MSINEKSEDLTKPVTPNSVLKEMIVNYVGEKINPENEEITVENIIGVFADEFPEFLLVVAEENWVNGYTQALNDVDFVNSQKNDNEDKEDGRLHKE